MTADFSSIRVAHADGVTHIELHRPAALNAWTPEMGRELLAAVRAAGDDAAVRAILLSGAGRAFSAGADVTVPRGEQRGGDPDLHTRLRAIYNPIVLAVRAAPKPVVAAVHGAAAGLGCSLALSCDLVIAAESAYFLLAFVHLGVMPDGGAIPFLVERIGTLRTNELIMRGRRLPAARALEWGLVNEVVPDAALHDHATALARELASGPTVALAGMKRMVGAAAQSRLAELLDFEATLQQRHATTADYAEGVAAFKQKRPPRFAGR